MSDPSTSRALPPGEEFLFAGVKMRAFDGALTGGQYSVIVSEFFAGWETPWHLHRLEDECLYLIRGSVSAKLGDEPYGTLRAGDFIFLPRGVAHGFRVLEETEILTVLTPPGLERFFREASFDFTEQDFTPRSRHENRRPAPGAVRPGDLRRPSRCLGLVDVLHLCHAERRPRPPSEWRRIGRGSADRAVRSRADFSTVCVNESARTIISSPTGDETGRGAGPPPLQVRARRAVPAKRPQYADA